MKINSLIYLVFLVGIILSGCEKDNYEPPKSMLQGRVLYNDKAIGVRSNGVELELWQHGYELFRKIPVMVDQDGSFSATLFNGDYKLVARQGAPWAISTDSIDVKVSGNTTIDFPVRPFYLITNENITRNGNLVTASFNIEKVADGGNIERVSMYVGKTAILDAVQKEGWADIWAADLGDLTEQKIMTIDLANFDLANRPYVFARAGIQLAGVPEMIYTDVVKLEL